MLGRIARRVDRRRGQESKAMIVAMIANEHAALCTARSQVSKVRLDELLADPTPLKRGVHRDRTNRKPPPQHITARLCPRSCGKEKWRILPVGEVHDHFVASGQIKLRRIDGWQKIAAVVSRQRSVEA